ncbi:MAG TPA: DUF2079 domain-containing protein [Ktedonobacteraceae bacterium]|nr:DUF2079 domain-containing protein [Ktedonobacteraceae bacterium]
MLYSSGCARASLLSHATWRKRIAVWRNRLFLYPAPEPLPRTPAFWLATALVALLVLLFSCFFIFYLTGKQDAYMTHAEDLGIMDQAIWNTVHGHLFHQTICNSLNDTNCYSFAGISRFALHFEPILFPVSLFYLIWPDPKMLLVIQTLVVASGAFPAFWLARLRLRNEWAGVAIALLYLLYPAQQNALTFDFHAVTFTSALLLFTLYFMYSRRTIWLFVFAVLAMACKEEIPLVVVFFGLWSMLFQRRWRSGLGLVLLASAWTALGFYVIHLNSPQGYPLLASRYAYLGHTPLQIAQTIFLQPLSIIKQHVHRAYFQLLFAPVGYLPLLAPWVFVLALPTMALNMLSSDPNMNSGAFQYSAEIVPVFIFAAIESIVLLLWLVQWGLARGSMRQEEAREDTHKKPSFQHRPLHHKVHLGLLALLLCYVLFSVINQDYTATSMPFARDFHWPQVTTHDELAQHIIDTIPLTASLSAQTRLVPHVSQRSAIYLFPDADDHADYIFLDVTGDFYPFQAAQDYESEVIKVMQSGNYGIVVAQDGYFLLERGLPPPAVLPYPVTQNLPKRGQSHISCLVPGSPKAVSPLVSLRPELPCPQASVPV